VQLLSIENSSRTEQAHRRRIGFRGTEATAYSDRQENAEPSIHAKDLSISQPSSAAAPRNWQVTTTEKRIPRPEFVEARESSLGRPKRAEIY
jgi:hypothetical protein